MKPYIAILIDSFWEAVGNRVLWALLIGWTLILAGLAPFGYITERSFQLTSSDVSSSSDIFEKLAKGIKGRETDQIQAVAQQLDERFKQRLIDSQDPAEDGKNVRPSEIAKQLNQVLKAPALYSAEVFPLRSERRRERLEPLIAAGVANLAAPELEELNRELIQEAFKVELHRPRGQQLWIGYGSLKIGDALPISRRQIREFLEPMLLATIIKLGLGVLAVFVAIIVTSPMIPDTFRSGSLHLLLSKPISRVWLYLAKFFGSCIFVLLNITFVLIGLYFIAGLRFEIWNAGLITCIPLLMFVFIIFYSVSALVGLLWGNAIVCVVSCMIFWLFCFALGAVHDTMLRDMDIEPQIRRIRTAGDEVLAVNEQGHLSVWNQDYSVWQPVVDPESRGQATTFGPIYDQSHEQIIFKSFRRDPFRLTARARNITLVRPGAKRATETAIEDEQEDTPEAAKESPDSIGPADDAAADDVIRSAKDARNNPRWMADSGPELPAQVFDVLEMKGALIAICRGGLFYLDFDKLKITQQAKTGLFGIKIPWLVSQGFENIAPPEFFISENTTASVTADGESLIVYSSGNIDRLRLTEGKFTVEASATLSDDSDGTEAAEIRANENYCVVARNGLPLTILDQDLARVATMALPKDAKVRQLASIPGTEDFAIVTHTGELLRVDCASKSIQPIQVAYSGLCTSMDWVDQDQVWLGVQPNRGYLLNLATNRVEQQLVPTATLWEKIFRYGVKPIYLVNPKPSALDNAMAYILSGERTQALNVITNDLESAQMELDIWQPIITNLCFVVVVLGLGCIYVARKEF
ncbi:MAG: ABC transporter permease [Planctomycetales bacterium]|nr:ABC transporter permease [Planctomycetales bacterium]